MPPLQQNKLCHQNARALFSIRSATNTLFQIRKATCKYFTVIWTIWNRVVNFYRIQIQRDICILCDCFCTANVHRKKNGMNTVIFIANLRILQPTSHISYMLKSYIGMHWFCLLQIPPALVFAGFQEKIEYFSFKVCFKWHSIAYFTSVTWFSVHFQLEKQIVSPYNLSIVFFWNPQYFPRSRG